MIHGGVDHGAGGGNVLHDGGVHWQASHAGIHSISNNGWGDHGPGSFAGLYGGGKHGWEYDNCGLSGHPGGLNDCEGDGGAAFHVGGNQGSDSAAVSYESHDRCESIGCGLHVSGDGLNKSVVHGYCFKFCPCWCSWFCHNICRYLDRSIFCFCFLRYFYFLLFQS